MRMSVSPELQARIRSALARHHVVLFMKGTRQAPQCGFSNQTVDLLDRYLDEYATVDVMADAALRDGLKAFSAWPTFPQLYAGGEFLGGADIVRELDAQGELATALGPAADLVREVNVTVTDAAATALKAALGEHEDPEAPLHVRLRIDARFYNDLSLGARASDDVVARSNGVEICFDPASARRAAGLCIDFVTEGDETGFKLDNPRAPKGVQEMSVTELAARLSVDGEAFVLFDVRTDKERELAVIEGAQVLDEAALDSLQARDKSTPIALHCHHGGRSARAAQALIDLGFLDVYNVVGGIDAWSQEVDPSVPRY